MCAQEVSPPVIVLVNISQALLVRINRLVNVLDVPRDASGMEKVPACAENRVANNAVHADGALGPVLDALQINQPAF